MNLDFIHLNKVVSIYKTIIWYVWWTAEVIEAGLREKYTDKFNFNPAYENTREEHPVSHKPLVYENSNPVSLQIFYEVQHTYSLNHIALENLFLLSLLATRYFTRRKNNCLCTRSIQHLCGFVIDHVWEGAVCQVMSKPCR